MIAHPRKGWVLIAVIALAACGQNPPRPSETEQAAVEWNQRAQAAYARADYEQALEHYHQALALNRAVEDVDGIARELVNLSTVYRKLGQREAARAALETVRVQSGIPFTPSQRAEATHRLALHAGEDGDARAAQALSDQALTLCVSAACPTEGAIRNFQAGLRLASGDSSGARDLARRALELNRRHGDRVEEANSLRLMADAGLRLNDPVAAADGYRQALAIDKADGASHKISADLLGLGQAALALGRLSEAADYFARARSVAEAAGDDAGRQQAENFLRSAKP